jgi:amidase
MPMPDNYLNKSEFIEQYQTLELAADSINLNAIIATTDRDDVAQSDAPLTGIAVAIKDNIEAIGLPASAGSLALTATVTRDAPLVTALVNAGAQLVAATNLSEWANLRSTHSTSGWSARGGLVGNPWALDRSSGGSSAGSGAAVAAGMVSLAIGTETDGSIVCPASVNGVVGLKPTVGSISRDGIVPVSLDQDTAGPLAVDVKLAAMAFSVMADQPKLMSELASADEIAKSLKVGVAKNWLTQHAATDAVFENAIAILSKLLTNVSESGISATPEDIQMAEFNALVAELKSDVDGYLANSRPMNPIKSLQEVQQFNLTNSLELKYFGQELFDAAVESGGRGTDAHTTARATAREWATRTQSEAFAEFDLLVAPTYGPAWKSDLTLGDRFIGGAVTAPAAIAGTPLLCIPMGLVNGLPVGLTIAGPANSELKLLALGTLLEQHLGCRRSDGFKPTFAKAARG